MVMTEASQERPKQPGVNLSKVHKYLVEIVAQAFENTPPPPRRRREFAQQVLEQAYARTRLNLAESLRAQLFRDVLDDLLGLGPIQPLLDDEDVTEVMVNGPNNVYVEKGGKLIKTDVTFNDDEHVLQVIDRIILPLGRRVDPDNPTVDARLMDGSRVNAVIPPVAIDGPSITIRKFARDRLTV